MCHWNYLHIEKKSPKKFFYKKNCEELFIFVLKNVYLYFYQDRRLLKNYKYHIAHTSTIFLLPQYFEAYIFPSVQCTWNLVLGTFEIADSESKLKIS